MLIPLLIVQIVTFLAIVLVLRALFYRNLKSALNRLNTLHEENLVKEGQLQEELERSSQERQVTFEKSNAEAKEIIEKTKKESDKLRVNLEEEARQEAKKIIEHAEELAEKSRQGIMAEVKKQALELSAQMIKFTFTSQGKENLQHLLSDEVISEIASLGKDKFTVTTNKVKVTSAFSLTEAERRNLTKILSEKLGSPVALEEHIDPELITGLVLEIGALLIDGSLKNRLFRAMVYLKGDR